uniref:Phlebovirus glycoprotein G2 fusion domain-containing protein n=1 Tax=Ditylenchus dipsaci TaxID=166011 RepID=A0A915E2M6_9BILA
MKTNEQIPEIGERINSLPGNTYCKEGCGCWLCGCFFCSPGCLFFREYALPRKDQMPYEVCSCASFKPEVVLKLTLSLSTAQSNSTEVQLSPGETIKWNDMKVSIAMPRVEPITTLTSKTYFLLHENGGALLNNPEDIPLKCATKEAAQQFKCYLKRSTCKCEAHEETVSCFCPAKPLKNILRDDSLPLQTPAVTIYAKNNTLKAVVENGGTVDVHLHMKTRISLLSATTTCHLQPLQLTGCYSCGTGALLEYKCTTKNDEELLVKQDVAQ